MGNILKTIKALLAPVNNKIMNVVIKAIVTNINDKDKLQLCDLLIFGDEQVTKIQRVQNYGFSSVPDGEDNEAVAVSSFGNREQMVVIAIDDSKSRPTNQLKGETIVYTKFGSKIILDIDGNIILQPASGKNIMFGDDTLSTQIPSAGIVTGQCICSFTGAPHPDKSSSVFAKRV